MLFLQSVGCRRPHICVIGIDREVSVFICTFTALLLRTVTWPSVHGADQTHHAPHWCARPGSAVRSALVWSRQGCSGLGRERQGRIIHLWLRGGGQVPAQAWPGSDLSCSSGKWPLSSWVVTVGCGSMFADTLDPSSAGHHTLCRELVHTACTGQCFPTFLGFDP